jgi:hypothetical protein
MKKTLLFGLSVTIVLSSSNLFSSIEAQEPERSQKWDPNWEPPRTAWGHPDLQGNWSNATLTRFERRQGVKNQRSEIENNPECLSEYITALKSPSGDSN